MNSADLAAASVSQLEVSYRTAALAHAEAIAAGRHRVANRNYDAITAIARELRSRSHEGSQALERMLDDSAIPVRVWAATHSLDTCANVAERVLLEVAGGPPSPTTLIAEMTLREWRAGRLHIG